MSFNGTGSEVNIGWKIVYDNKPRCNKIMWRVLKDLVLKVRWELSLKLSRSHKPLYVAMHQEKLLSERLIYSKIDDN